MSIYSYTRVEQFTPGTLNARTRNICVSRKLLTVKDIWDYYQANRTFLGITNIGKKGNNQLIRICKRADEVMRTLPVTDNTTVSASLHTFSIVTFFNSLDEDAKKVAENFFARYANRLRSNTQSSLMDICDELTLEAFVNTLTVYPTAFKEYTETAKGRRSEIGQFLQAIYRTFASETFAQYIVKPRLTLLTQEMNALLQCTTDNSMDKFLANNFDKLATGEFPLGLFIDIALRITTELHTGTRKMLRKAFYWSAANQNNNNAGSVASYMRVSQEKLWRMFEERGVLRLGRSAIELLQKYGFTIPQTYILPDEPFHAGTGKGTLNYYSFNDLFIILLFNPSLRLVDYKVQKSAHVLLIQHWIPEQFAITLFLNDINKLQSECIREAYTIDLPELMDQYYETTLSPEDEKGLFNIIVSIVSAVYDLTTDDDEQLELKRTSKKQTWEHIYDFLKEKGEPCEAIEIQEELKKSGVNVTLDTVRNNVSSKRDIFIIAGRGLCGLQEWKSKHKVPRTGELSNL